MVKKIPIVDVNVTSSISGTVQPLGPTFGGGSVSIDSLNSVANSTPSIIYTDSFVISAINIVIPRDFVRTFSDIGILFDSPSIGYNKRLTDSINSINDNEVFNLSKFVSNLANTSDNFNRVVDFIRKPEDTLIIDDNFNRVVDFIRKPEDTIGVSEESVIDFNKPLSDSANSIDNRVFNLSKVVSNSVNTSGDFTTINFSKSPFETVNVSEESVIDFNKPLSDSADSIDVKAINFSKIFVNSVNTSGDSTVINFTKSPFDTVNVSEESSIDFNKPLSDNVNPDDLKAINFTKIRFDAVDVSEESDITFSKVSSDITTISDFVNTIDFIKRLFETVDVLEEPAIDFNKPLADVSVIQDLAALTIAKLFADSYTVDDSDTIDFTKGNFETLVTSDRNDLVFSKALIEVLQSLDLPAITVQKILSDANNIADFNAIDFTKLNVDSVSTESFTVLSTTKSIFDISSTEDKPILDFEKNASDSITTVDNISRLDFIKVLADTATVEDLTNIFDGSTYTIDKTVTDFVNSSEIFSRIVDYNRAFQDDQSINELLAIDFNKILESTASNNDNLALNVSLFKTDSIIGIEDVFNKVVEYNRLFTDEQSQLDLHIVDFAKVLADINSINDDDVLSITKVLSSELSNISEISIIDFNKFRSDQVDATDIFDRTVSFNRSLTDIVLQPDLAALSVTKPLSDAIGHFDGPVQYDSDGWAVDYVVSGYIFDTRVVFDVIKALSDINSTADNDVIDFTKGLADLIDPQDNDVIDFTKVRADETITSDDDILDFTKALADVVTQPDGPIQYDSDGWAVGYVVSGYIFDTRVVFDITKPLTDSIDPQDDDVINFTKALADENLILLDDDILDFTKALADLVIDNLDGPIQYGSDGWAVDYVVSGYIFDTRVVFDVIKALADSNSTTDDDFYNLAKVLADLTSGFQETNIFDFTKVLADENITLESKAIAFTKALADVVIDNLDGPRQYDSDGWAVDYVVPGYIFDTRVVFDVIKAVADAVQQPDDSDVFDLNKVLADFNDSLDSNIIDFTKVLADDAEALDNIDVFDGSTYSFTKNLPNVSIFAEDQNTNVVDFNRAFTDSINSITEAGLVANQNYIADYFAEDYIGEVRLIV